jgi:hypothetical protein
MHMMRLGSHWRTAASLLDRNARLFGRIEPGCRFVEIGVDTSQAALASTRTDPDGPTQCGPHRGHPLAAVHEP